MPRVDYKEMLMDENFYPCNQCGDTEFYLDFDIYKCTECGGEMEIRKISKTLKLKEKKKLRKFREE
jgi:hypothetical protein